VPWRTLPARLFFVRKGLKAIKDSLTEVPHNPPPHASAQADPSEDRRNPLARFIFIGAVTAMIAVAGILALETTPTDSRVEQFGRFRAIQIDVQNGAGEPKLAQRATDYLRTVGFDVVEMGNYKSDRVPKTLVIDRTGNLAAARSVAAALGISEEDVVQQIDKNLFLDVTVVIGRDYSKLKAFR